uniref:Uncharacterized protein n=1 Tax=Rhizophora mucronata TaxID=61149 RepID=A0A2P2R1U7_RHIMU
MQLHSRFPPDPTYRAVRGPDWSGLSAIS